MDDRRSHTALLRHQGHIWIGSRRDGRDIIAGVGAGGDAQSENSGKRRVSRRYPAPCGVLGPEKGSQDASGVAERPISKLPQLSWAGVMLSAVRVTKKANGAGGFFVDFFRDRGARLWLAWCLPCDQSFWGSAKASGARPKPALRSGKAPDEGRS